MERGVGEGANKFNISIIRVHCYFVKPFLLFLRANFFWSAKSIDGNDVLSHLRVNGLSWFFSLKGAMKGYHTKGFHRVLRNFLHDLSFFSTHFQQTKMLTKSKRHLLLSFYGKRCSYLGNTILPSRGKTNVSGPFWFNQQH